MIAPFRSRALFAFLFAAASLRATTITYTGLSTTDTTSYTTTTANPYTFAANGSIATESGIIDGNGSLTKTGAGILTLSGANTYTGDTIVSAGSLTFANTLDAGNYAGAITVSGTARITFSSTASQTLSGVISGTGSFSTVGTGTLTLSGANTYTGNTTVGNTLILTGTLGSGNYAGNITIGGGKTLNLASASDQTLSGVISGGSLLQTGTGTVTFTGNNTGVYMTVNAGTLKAGSAGAFADTYFSVGSAGTIDIGSFGLDLVNFDEAGSDTGTIKGSGVVTYGANPDSVYNLKLTGAVSFLKTGIADLTLSGANTYTGGTTVASGSITFGSATALGSGPVAIASGASVNTASYSADLSLYSGAGFITGSGVFAYNAAAAASFGMRLTGSGSFLKSGAGALTLSGTEVYTGATTVSAGSLIVTGTLGGGNYAGAIVNSGVINFASSTDQTLSGIISGTGTLLKSGTGKLTLSGNDTYSGATTVSAGTLTFSGNNRISSATTLDLTGGVTLDLAGTTQTVAGLGDTTTRVVGDITAGTLAVTGPAYVQSGTFANRWSGNSATARLWIGGDTGATVMLNGTNDAVYTVDHNQVIIGNAVTGAAGVVQLGNANALTAATENAQVFSGTLDLNGQTNVRGAGIALLGGSASVLTNGSATTAASFAGGVTVATGATIGGAGDLTLSGKLTYSGNPFAAGFTKVGTGTLTLSGDNSGYTAYFTTIAAGTLRVGTGGSLGALGSFGGSFITNNGSLVFDLSSDTRLFSAITGTGSLTQAGTGVLTLYAGNGYTGGTFVTAGMIGVSDPTNFGSGNITLNGGGLVLNGYDVSARFNAIGAAGAVFDAGSTTTLASVLTGTGGVTEVGTGTLTLSAANTYAGGTTIAGGTLLMANAGALSTGPVVVAAGATLDSAGYGFDITRLSGAGTLAGTGNFTYDSSASATFGGLTGTGTLVKSGSGTLTLSGTSLNYTGNITITAGTLAVTGLLSYYYSPASGYYANIANAGTIRFASDSDQYVAGAISGTGALVKAGAGTLTLVAGNTYSGGTTITGGTLNFFDLSALGTGTLTFDGGGVLLQTGLDISSRMTAIGSGGATINTYNEVTFATGLTGTGGLTKTGARGLTLTAVNTYTGDTTIASGTFTVSGTLGSGNYAGAINNAGAVNFSSTSDQIISGVISGTGTIDVSYGKVILTGANTTTGSVSIYVGSLQLGNGGTTGSLAAASNITFTYQASLIFDRSDTITQGVDFSAAAITGTGSFIQAGSGTVILTANNAYSGITTINAGGTLQMGNGGTAGSAGAMVSAGVSANGYGNIIVDNGALVFKRSDDISTPGYGLISGTGSLAQSGTGTLTLTYANTYSGGTFLNAGALALGVNGAIGTGMLTINGGALRASGGVRTVANAVTLAGDFTLGRGLTLSGPVALTNDITITSANPDVAAASSSTLSGAISGAYGLTFVNGVNPTGTIILSGNNAYTGVTTITSGILQIGAGGTTGSLAGDVVDNASLIFNRSDASSYAGVISGTGSLTKTGAGSLALSGTNTYAGGTTITGGLLAFTTSANFGTGTLSLNGGGLRWTTGNTTDISASFAAIGAAGATFDTNGNDVTFASVLSGTGALIKSGAGALSLTAANTYAGGTTITGGMIAFSSLANFGTGTITLNGGGLRWNAGNTTDISGVIATPGSAAATFDTNGNNVVFASAINGSGGLVKAGAGTLTLAANNGYAGTTTISGGTLAIGAGGTTGSVSGSLVDNAVLVFNRSNATTFSGAVSGTGTVTQAGTGDLALYGILSGSLAVTNNGSGAFSLYGNNTYSGGTTLNSGTLGVGSDTALGSGTLTINGGGIRALGAEHAVNNAMVFNGDFTLGRLTDLNGAIALTKNVTITNANPDYYYYPATATIGGVISGAYGVTFAAGANAADSISLRGTNTYTGGTTVNGAVVNFASLANFGTGALTSVGGTFQWATGTATDLSARLAVIDTAGVTFDTNGNDVAFANALSGAGMLTKTGAGTLTLAETNTYAGGTTITGGTIGFTSFAAFGTGPVTLNGGGLRWAPGNTADVSASGLTIGSRGAVFDTNGNDVTFATAIGGSSSITKTGAGTLTLAAANTYSGYTYVSGGTLALAADNRLDASSYLVIANGATLDLRGHTQTFAGIDSAVGNITAGTIVIGYYAAIDNGTFDNNWTGSSDGSGLYIGSNVAGTVYLNGTNDAVDTAYHTQVYIYGGTVILGNADALAAATETVMMYDGTLDLNGASDVRMNSLIMYGGSLINGDSVHAASFSKKITTFGGNFGGDGDLTLSGVIDDAGNNAVITKVGAGTLTLSGANTYTGATLVTAGRLLVNGSLASGGIIVSSGATLGGNGNISGPATLLSGAHLAAGGATAGTLTFTGGVTLNTGVLLDFRLGVTSDMIRLGAGSLTGTTGVGGITVNLADAGGFTSGTYTLIDFNGGTVSDLDAGDFVLGDAIAGYDYTFGVTGNTLQVTAVSTAVPEPSTYGLLGAGLLAAVTLVRRRRRMMA